MEKVETRSEFANLYLSSASLPLDALMLLWEDRSCYLRTPCCMHGVLCEALHGFLLRCNSNAMKLTSSASAVLQVQKLRLTEMR